MKKILFFAIFFLFFLSSFFAQIAPVVPVSTSIANTSVAEKNEWNAFQNTASLAHIKKGEIAVQYENRFVVNELSTRSIQGGFSTKFANFGASYSYHGYSVFNEMIAGLGVARNFGDMFSMGVQLNYYSAYFSAAEESRYRGTVLAQFGVVSTVLPKLSIGFHTFNPFQTEIKTENYAKRLPSIFSFGANYAFSEDLKWLSQIDKEVSSNFRLATGFEYTMLKQITLKLGVYGSEFLIPALGFGFHFGNIYFTMNGELHPLLGLNTHGNIRYKF